MRLPKNVSPFPRPAGYLLAVRSGGAAPPEEWGPRRLPFLLAVGGLLVGAALLCPFRVGRVQGRSMDPTLRPGQWFVYEDARSREEVRPGDLVLVRRGRDTLVKRLVAMGGGRVWQVAAMAGEPGALVLPDDRSAAQWRARFPRFRYRAVPVPADAVYVVGDSACSQDCRHFGPLPRSAVVGKVLFPSGAGFPDGGVVRDHLPPLPPPEARGARLARAGGLP